MYAWYCPEACREPLTDGYRLDRKSFDAAYDEATKILLARVRDWFRAAPEDVEWVGTAPFGEEMPWTDKALTKDEIRRFVDEEGWCQFKAGHKDKKTYLQGWIVIHTMKSYRKEQRQLKKDMQEFLQDEADRTGKKLTANNGCGLALEAKPKKKKRA